jgi:hypothetical protein
MALPFKVFDYGRYDGKWAYCLRCQAWVPIVGRSGGVLDPHIEDHIIAWMEMKRVEAQGARVQW